MQLSFKEGHFGRNVENKWENKRELRSDCCVHVGFDGDLGKVAWMEREK